MRRGLEYLFSPQRLGKVALRNRIVMPAMLTALATPDGEVSEPMLAYYKERAGGVGLIIVESANVEVPQGDHFLRQLSSGGDRYINGLSRLAEIIYSKGAAAALQICHQGRYSAPIITGTHPLSPVYEPPVDFWPESRAIVKSDIEKLIEEFANASLRSKRAGFDAVEIHGAHGYLITQFLSPLTNRRGDEYGGDVTTRSRFLEELIKSVRTAVEDDYPVILRLSADEMVEGGLTVEDTVFYAHRAKLAGIDAFHITAGTHHSKKPISIAPMSFPPGFLSSYAERIRKKVPLPVITVGRINDPFLANDIIQAGKADLTAMGRALIADPDLPNKAENGETKRIRKCLACNYCIESNIQKALPLRCAINPRAGREIDFPPITAKNPRRVWVIGAGPAGMQAALTCREMGHTVRLYERSPYLGGQLIPASKTPWKEAFYELILYFQYEMEKAGVEIILGEEAPSPKYLGQFPDVVIVATGSKPAIPEELLGLDDLDYLTARQAITWEKEIGDRVIVIGGERSGIEVAAFLARRGKRVFLTRRQKKLAKEMVPSVRKIFLDFLQVKNVEIFTNISYLEFRKNGLLINQEGKERFLEADTVILATGSTPVHDIFEDWSSSGVTSIPVGDCVEPRDLTSAIREGFEAAYSV